MLLILAGDPAATEKSIRITQGLLKEYFHREKPCSMELSLRLKLFELLHASPARLLRAAKSETEVGQRDGELFE